MVEPDIMPADGCRRSAVISRPTVIGPYRILDILGQGGMGIVARAAHQMTGHEVALKTVRIPGPGLGDAIQREIHALAAIRHPGVAQILDQGVHNEVPWYAMELIRGQSLRRHWAQLVARERAPKPDSHLWGEIQLEFGEAPLARSELVATSGMPWWIARLSDDPDDIDVPIVAERSTQRVTRDLRLPTPGNPDPIEGNAGTKTVPTTPSVLVRLLEIVCRLCDALAHLHSRGIVHGDLKPENIVVRSDGHPVLVDFGLTAFLGTFHRRSAVAAGTAEYVSPEQARGQQVDQRADLYALGCMLFEFVTGHPPFRADDPVEILRQHVEVLPTLPATGVYTIPSELEALILGLLAKSPRMRPGHAAHVGRVLRRISGVHVRLPSRPAPAYLYNPRFSGRLTVLDQIEDQLSQLVGGAGGAVLVSGEPGIGKTRVLGEAVSLAQRLGVQVLSATRATPPHLGSKDTCQPPRPFSTLEPLVTAIIGYLDERELAAHELAPLLWVAPSGQSQPIPTDLPVTVRRQQLFAALAAAIDLLVVDQPVVFVVDDLQWADSLSAAALRYLARRSCRRTEPFLVLAAYTTGSGGQRPRLAETEGVLFLPLEQLEAAHVGRMLVDMLAEPDPPEELVEFLARSADGNPFWVVEYLRTAVHTGLLRRDVSGFWEVETIHGELDLPRTLEGLVEHRLRLTDPVAKLLVEAAAVLGATFNRPSLSHVSGVAELPSTVAIRHLLAHKIWLELADGQFSFAHHHLRRMAARQIPPERIPPLHGRARMLVDSDCEPLVWARHDVLATGSYGDAVTLWQAASRRSARLGAWDEAELLYEQLLRSGWHDADQLLELQLQLATDVLPFHGGPPRKRALWERILEKAQQLEDWTTSARAATQLLTLEPSSSSEGTKIRAAAVELLDHPVGPDCLAGLLKALASSSPVDAREGALGRLAQALEVVALPSLRAEILLNRAELTWEGDHTAALADAQAALDLLAHDGASFARASALLQVARCEYRAEALDQAELRAQQALLSFRALGAEGGTGESNLLLARIYTHRDDLATARRHLERALAIFRLEGDLNLVGRTSRRLADVVARQGEPEWAEALLSDAVQLFRQLGRKESVSRTLAALVELERRSDQPLGRIEWRLTELEKSLAHNVNVPGPTRILAICARGHLALARGEDAGPLMRAAEALSEAVCDKGAEKAIERLRLAIADLANGQALVRGESRSTLPEAFL